jgi:hypothetical protein
VSGIVLETKRLLLREFRDDDLEAYAGMLADPETMRYYPRPYTRDEARGFIEKNRHRYAADGFGVWVIAERGTEAFLGDCGLAFALVEGTRRSRSSGTWSGTGGDGGSPRRRPGWPETTLSGPSASAGWWPWSARRTSLRQRWPGRSEWPWNGRPCSTASRTWCS